MSQTKFLKALMVEDNIDHADLMLDALYEFNNKNVINHVIDGEQAIAYLRNDPPFEDKIRFTLPDIILLDIRMPRQGGIETLEIIKADDQLCVIPVVMISTSTTEAEIKACYKLGANGYITKPLDFDDFSDKIKALNHYWASTSELPQR